MERYPPFYIVTSIKIQSFFNPAPKNGHPRYGGENGKVPRGSGRMSRRARRASSKKDRADAVGLVRRSGMSVAHIARDLDIGENSLRAWVKQADIDDGPGPDGELTTTEREELRQLR